jgi:hypothetical protein
LLHLPGSWHPSNPSPGEVVHAHLSVSMTAWERTLFGLGLELGVDVDGPESLGSRTWRDSERAKQRNLQS